MESVVENSLCSSYEVSKGRVLIVDDDSSILRSLNRTLRPLGYKTLTAENGEQALSLMRDEPIDVVISDMRMPGMDGATLLGKIDKKWPKLPCILLTGYSDLDSTIKAINTANIYAYFAKPWDTEKLRDTVEKAMQSRTENLSIEKQGAYSEQRCKKLIREKKELQQQLYKRSAEILRSNQFLKIAYAEIDSANTSAIRILTTIAQNAKGVLNGHAEQVAKWSVQVAYEMGIPESEIVDIQNAALLLDFQNLTKPNLSQHYGQEIWKNIGSEDQLKLSMENTARVLREFEPLSNASIYMAHVYDRYDGKGFLNRLKGEEIPIHSRIIAAAKEYALLCQGIDDESDDSFDATLEQFQEMAGNRLDPKICQTLAHVVKRHHENDEPASEKALPSHCLKPGMILSRDILNSKGDRLLTNGQQLTHEMIARLRSHEENSGESFTIYIDTDSSHRVLVTV